MGAFKTPSDIESVVVKVDRDRFLPSEQRSLMASRDKNQSQPKTSRAVKSSPQVLISSLGRVRDAFQERTSYSRYDGRENVSLSILKQGEANIVSVAEAAKKKLEDIKTKLPEGVNIKIVYDQSTFIKNGIADMVREGITGSILSFLVLYFFLGSYRNALVVGAVIPASIMITIFLLYVNGVTLNTISLSGLVVGIGLVVDGAIVIIENITRHKEHGQNAETSSERGALEVVGAVLSSGATQIVVFLPLIFVVGIIGQVFKDFSLSIVFTHSSLLVYFTLLPMLAAVALVGKQEKNIYHDKLERFGASFNKYYDKALKWAFDNPVRFFTYSAAACLVSIVILSFLPKELFPKVDQGQFILNLKMPIGTKLDVTNSIAEKLDILLSNTPEVSHRMTTVGSVTKEGIQPLGENEAQIVVDLKERRRHKTDVVIQDIKRRLERLDLYGGKATFSQQEGGSFSFISSGGSPIVIELKGYDLDDLYKVTEKLKYRLKEINGVFNITSSLNLSSQEIGVDVLRDNLATYGLSVNDIANTMLTAVKGKVASKFREEGKEIDIRVRLSQNDRQDLRALNNLLLRSPLEFDVPLESVALLSRRLGPSEILHYDQQRTAIVSAGLFKKSFSSIEKPLERLLDKMHQENPNFTFNLSGEATQLAESFSSLKMVIILSLLLVYMIMAAQFESLWKPFLIMLTIPLSLIGMAPALLFSGNSVSIMAGVGLVLLCGITVNNGIVLIDFANHEISQGVKLKDALWNACHIRLRPIMITAFTTVLGLFPLAIGFGKEAKMQSPMAIVVIFGFLVSTCLTLLFLPTLYLYTEEKIFKRNK